MSGAPVIVHPANLEPQRGWDADGEFWAAHDARFEANMAAYEHHLLAAAAISTGESVLDVGCGTGPTTRDAARLVGDGRAVGIDLSPAMIARARQRTREQGLPNVDFRHHNHRPAFRGPFHGRSGAGPRHLGGAIGVAYSSSAWIIKARSPG